MLQQHGNYTEYHICLISMIIEVFQIENAGQDEVLQINGSTNEREQVHTDISLPFWQEFEPHLDIRGWKQVS